MIEQMSISTLLADVQQTEKKRSLRNKAFSLINKTLDSQDEAAMIALENFIEVANGIR